jgi:hypothetical protein
MKHVGAGGLPNLGIRLEIFEADATVGEHVMMLRLTEWDLFQSFFNIFQAPPFLSLQLPARTISDLGDHDLNLVLVLQLDDLLLPGALSAA